MRLTCPNCAAQYEVPDDVIPEEGRDVQCSNCGQTWFEGGAAAQAGAPEAAPDADGPAARAEGGGHAGAGLEIGSQPEAAATQDGGIAEADDGRPGADPSASAAEFDEEDESEEEPAAAAAPGSFTAPVRPAERREQRGLDPSLSDVLRQEAEREAQLRAAEAGGLETQPDLGLDGLPEDETARRARQTRDRMARMRGEDPRQLAAAESGSRRELLPDIEEINSTLRAGEAAAPMAAAAAEYGRPRRKGGFTRGFALAVLAVLILVMIYDNAPLIAAKLPGADPYLSSYVASVDQARLWLDAQVKSLAAPQ